jgi:nicotinamide-nucleotide amidase
MIDLYGVVSEEIAIAMARAVRAKVGSTWSIATTGVAGPGRHHGIEAGTVWIAISGPEEATERLALDDIGREQVRSGAVEGSLTLLGRILRARS